MSVYNIKELQDYYFKTTNKNIDINPLKNRYTYNKEIDEVIKNYKLLSKEIPENLIIDLIEKKSIFEEIDLFYEKYLNCL